jgi:hypothetical protein
VLTACYLGDSDVTAPRVIMQLCKGFNIPFQLVHSQSSFPLLNTVRQRYVRDSC